MSTAERERGAASLLATACLGVLVLIGAALAVVGAMVADHRRAQAAADLAALSGATALQRGQDACAEAGRVATANQARLAQCQVAGQDVVVSVRVTGPRWLGQQADLEGHARAGPGE